MNNMTFENFELKIYTKININTCALTYFCSFFMRNLWLWIKCPLLSDLDCLPDRLFCLVLQQSVYQKRDVRNAADDPCDDRTGRRGAFHARYVHGRGELGDLRRSVRGYAKKVDPIWLIVLSGVAGYLIYG